MTTIRPATPDDAHAIAHVHVKAWRTAYRHILPEHVLLAQSEEQRRLHWQTSFETHRPNAFTFVAEQKGQVIGFVDGGPERGGDPEYPGEIYALYLLAEFRGQRIGSALFDRAVQTLKAFGILGMKVWVLGDNPYRRFYERHAGKPIGEKVILIGGEEFMEVAYGWVLTT